MRLANGSFAPRRLIGCAPMGTFDGKPQVQLDDRASWREWLERQHASSTGVWLVSWRRATGRPTLEYEAAIEEALCFGWVDGQAKTIDEERGALYFAPRKKGSAWAMSNKARVQRLIADGRMAPAGLAAIERAKADGSWTVFDGPARLEEPAELTAALDDAAGRPDARRNWNAFSASVRRMALEWIALAKRDATRRARIERVADGAQRNERVPIGGSG
jgi:uncharacterized protein YdeI (YjbR/CyaY-like superfamily)